MADGSVQGHAHDRMLSTTQGDMRAFGLTMAMWTAMGTI